MKKAIAQGEVLQILDLGKVGAKVDVTRFIQESEILQGHLNELRGTCQKFRECTVLLKRITTEVQTY